ncbi:unnamed protein product [Polarella glacialis]|uniref:Uncharacterized protein n=1 Tax=Polarella glacialis TaxID=89957 RepID=A0A813KM13_POLGL|nr:unnamed protein product [Polarella glacialis]
MARPRTRPTLPPPLHRRRRRWRTCTPSRQESGCFRRWTRLRQASRSSRCRTPQQWREPSW